jgi:uncharacterized protein (TIGR03435 family)
MSFLIGASTNFYIDLNGIARHPFSAHIRFRARRLVGPVASWICGELILFGRRQSIKYWRRNMSGILARRILVIWAFFSALATGQTVDHPEFEVASVKPAAPHADGMWIRSTPGGRVTVTNMTLKQLIVSAWQVLPSQISGGPQWVDSARYDISAKAEKPFEEGELPLMIQSLLTDRFQLLIRHEMKELPTYALVLANKGGKLGSGLTESKPGSCTPADASKPPPPPKPGKPPTLGCGGVAIRVRGLAGESIPISRFAWLLARVLGRPVIDRTGLTGYFDVNLEWTADDIQAASDGTGPSIFTAVQDQLGLKLESQKGPVEILVVERAERPSEN